MLRRFSSYGIARIVPAALNFAAIAIYTRLLGQDEYGRYALVVAASGLASSFMFTWLRMGLLRFYAELHGQHDVFLATLLRGYMWGIGASTVAVVAYWPFADEAIRELLPFGLMVLWTTAAYELDLQLAVSQIRPLRYGVLAAARAIGGVGCATLLAWHGLGVRGVLGGMAIGAMIPLAWAVPSQWQSAMRTAPDPQLLRRVLAYTAPLVATLSLEFVINASDRFLLGLMKGTAVVGTYAVAYDLAQQTLTVLLVTVNLAAYPAALRALEAHGPQGAQAPIREHGIMIAAVGLPAAALLALLSTNIAHLAVGADFRPAAAQLIPIVALATLVGGLKSYYFDLSFQFAKATANQIWLMAIAALVNVSLNLALIPGFGATGAAWATVGAYGVGLVLSWWRGRVTFVLPIPWRTWLRVGAATAVMAIAIQPIRSQVGFGALVLQGSVAAVALLASYAALNILGLRDGAVRIGTLALRGRPR